MARRFVAASNDRLTFGLGACGFATGPLTIAALIRPASTPGQPQTIWSTSGGGVTQLMRGSDTFIYWWDGAATRAMNTGLPVNEWGLVAWTKAAGTVIGRGHVYLYSTNVWVHANAGNTSAAPTQSGVVTIGLLNPGTQPFDGDIAVVGIWDTLLSDAQIESLALDLAAWYAPAQPRGLWLLDQAAVTMSVPDLSGGGANQTAIVGTTVSTNSVPIWTPGEQVTVVA